jgi:DNA polymerase III alpha subunit
MIKIIREVTKDDLKNHLYNIDKNDPQLYEELNKTQFGIFQFTGELAKQMTKRVHPTNFEEMIIINSCARPGTSMFLDGYINYKENPKYPKSVNDFLKITHGQIIWQEQVMNIFHEFGGFNFEEVNEIRGLLKKLGKANKQQSDIDKWKEKIAKFTENAREKGFNERYIENFKTDLEQLASYQFNRCFAGSCKITREDHGVNLTIEEMFKIKNDLDFAKQINKKSLRAKYNSLKGYGGAFSLIDNRLKWNKIIDIRFSGKRIVYEIETKNGFKLKITSNHKMPIFINGTYEEKTLDTGLKIGDILYTNGGYDNKRNFYNFSEFNKNNRLFKEYSNEGFLFGEENSGYKNERKVKNDKGNLVELSPIISIKKCKRENTYDIEMADPFHTICVNNILGCNSHAYAYSYIALMNLYLAKYFRQYFYSATLTNEATKKDELKDAVKAVNSEGFKILPPDINESFKDFSSTNNNSIRFGLSSIKGLSDKSTEIIIKNRETKNYISIIDFILRNLDERIITKRVVEALICSGTFDNIINKERVKYSKICEKFYEEKKSKKIPEILETLWNNIESYLICTKTEQSDLVKFDEEYLGGNYFYSVFPKNIEEYVSTRTPTETLLKLRNSERKIGYVPCAVKIIREHIQKNNGETMLFIDIEDINGEKISLPIFSSYYKHCKKNFNNNGFYWLMLYFEEGLVKFGSPSFTKDSVKERMIKKIEI